MTQQSIGTVLMKSTWHSACGFCPALLPTQVPPPSAYLLWFYDRERHSERVPIGFEKGHQSPRSKTPTLLTLVIATMILWIGSMKHVNVSKDGWWSVDHFIICSPLRLVSFALIFSLVLILVSQEANGSLSRRSHWPLRNPRKEPNSNWNPSSSAAVTLI